MPKRKKTLKEKKHADERRHVTHETTHLAGTTSRNHQSHEMTPESIAAPLGNTFSLPTNHTQKHTKVPAVPVSRPTTVTISTNEYGYLGKDLLKTGFLTVFVVAAELMIRFFFERG